MTECPVIIVGAGPAGLGTALALHAVGVSDVLILERYEVGASFLRWPEETRFITPSFPARGYGVSDLNTISDSLDPGFRGPEHPSGMEYADYLQEIVRRHRLPVIEGVDVRRVDRQSDGRYLLNGGGGAWLCSCLVWATGEFQFPRKPRIPGAEHGLFAMSVPRYRDLPGEAFVVIGGFESGVDVACALAERGARIDMVDPHAWWDEESLDPSCALSPVSRVRLNAARSSGCLRTHTARALRIRREPEGFTVELDTGRELYTQGPPLFATGFGNGLAPIAHLIEPGSDGAPQLNEDDEVTRSPGLFLAGPVVRRGAEKLCFIYKFRTRFPRIAECIAERLHGSFTKAYVQRQ